MMKPADVKNVVFKKAFQGYNYEEVDEYINKVAEDYEKLYTENAQLVAKMDVLIERIEKYREDEDALKTALVNAQRLGDTIKKEAQRKAEDIVAAAAIKSRTVERDISENAKKKKREFDIIAAAVSELKGKMSDLFRTQIEEINRLAAEAEDIAVELAEHGVGEREEEKIDSRTLYDEIEQAAEQMTEEHTPDEQLAEPIEDATIEFQVEIPEEALEGFGGDEDVVIKPDGRQDDEEVEEKDPPAAQREIYFGADYKLDEEDSKRGLFGRKR